MNNDTLNPIELAKSMVIISEFISSLDNDLSFDVEHYWEIDSLDKYDTYELSIEKSSLGALSDDISRITKLIEDKDRADFNSVRSLAQILLALVHTKTEIQTHVQS